MPAASAASAVIRTQPASTAQGAQVHLEGILLGGHLAEGLASNTTYYYTFKASNSLNILTPMEMDLSAKVKHHKM